MRQDNFLWEDFDLHLPNVEVGAYIIDEDIIVSYDLCITRQEHMDKYINSEKWTLIGYGYCVNTTLTNIVSADTEVSAFFTRNF